MKEGGDELTDDDARCYIDRYPDLDMFNNHFEPAPDALSRAKMHYESAGKDEGRNPYCAPVITDQQARCYFENYPELKSELGLAGYEGNYDKLKSHWRTKGFDEGRQTTCLQVDQPKDYDAYLCGKQGELCSCTGTIFYTKLYNEGNTNAIAVNSSTTSTTKGGYKQTIVTSSYWSSSDPDVQPTVTTHTLDNSFVQLDSDIWGPYNKDNDPFEKMRTEQQASDQKPNGPSLVQLEESGPYDRNTNPFEQFRNGPPSPGPSGPYDRSNNPFEQFRTPPPAQKKQPMAFVEAISWAYKTIADPPQGSLVCGSSVMGEPHPGHKMQCFCEPHLPREPHWCAKQGQECGCKGRVFLGNAASAASPNTTFEEMLTEPYTVKRLGATQGSLTCSVKAMGFDPNPGMDKHCYCDGDLTYNQTLIDEALDAFEAKRQELAAIAAEKVADLERKKAEEEAVGAQDAADRAIKAAEEAEKKREKEILAEEEAAKKKAEEEEKAAREAAQAKEKADLKAAQEAAVAAAEAEHQANIAKLNAEQEEADLTHAKTIRSIQAKIDAHAKLAAAQKKEDQEREKLFQANQAKIRASITSKLEQQRARAKKLEDDIEAAKRKTEEMAKEQAALAKIKFQKQREAAIKQRNLAEKQRIQKAIQGKISLAVAEFQKKQQLKE